MSIFQWFNATEAKTFGHQLAEVVIDRTPANLETVRERGLTKKHEATLFQLDKQITKFRKTQSLNLYQKAQLGNAFKWRLRDQQYDSEYVDQLTAWILRRC